MAGPDYFQTQLVSNRRNALQTFLIGDEDFATTMG